MDRYFLPRAYKSRLEPEYFVDENLNAVWQPDLYPEAATVARRLGSRRIVDVGCGTAGKLAALHPEFDIVGIDLGSNIAACRERYDFGTWIETDLDTSSELGFDDLAAATIVCGDVIEHLVNPRHLLEMLRAAIDRGAAAIFLSTPERELINEPGHLGPPEQGSCARVDAVELEQLLASQGLHGYFGLTRSNDVTPHMRTILAAIPGDDAASREVVRDWFDERRKWQQLAQEQDRLLAEHEAWLHELTIAKDWAGEQYLGWKARAEAAEERLAQYGLGASSGKAPPEEAAEAGGNRPPPRITVVTEVERERTGARADLGFAPRPEFS